MFFVSLAAFEWLGLSLMRMAPMTKQADLFFGTVMTCFGAVVVLVTAIAAVVVVSAGGLEKYGAMAASMLAATFA